MIFTSLDFLLFYIALMGLLCFFKQNSIRQFILLIASYLFYGWWNPTFVILIIALSIIAWYLGLLIDGTEKEKKKNLYLAISITLSLGVLAYYKYATFLVDNIIMLLGLKWDYHLGITLPVGISFFTFQTMSYVIDLKRRKITVCKNLAKFMLYVAFFPQLVAGPIVRASEFLPQLSHQIKITRFNIIIGLQIFLGGAIQKVLFADNLSLFVNPVFSQPELFSGKTLWLAVTAYSLQIFCDFSGYSLMAIGIAKTLGFELPENFRMPYISSSITEFWRRWHITLSFWLRDYLYISLGGNRKGAIRTYLNLIITMLLGGLWHGAGWNFVLWGGLHGIALAVHKLWMSATQRWDSLKNVWSYKVLSWTLTFLFVTLSWIPFRCDNFQKTRIFFSNLLPTSTGIDWINPYIVIIIMIMASWHIFYIIRSDYLSRFPNPKIQRPDNAFVLGFAVLMIVLFAPMDTSPFIYFQF
ncbi:MAG: MBOAT family O-acyltransferase [Pleurocapsa sp. MO_226.B13]|nr:MBOAT family O-acyltransferase [Pleurocapsa sp. MO_226.B13]